MNNLVFEFFNKNNVFAVIGVSQNPKKFGHIVYEALKKKGFQVVPLNPSANQICSDKCFNTIDDLPDNVSHAIILTKASETDNVLRNLASKGIFNVWIQQMSETKDSPLIADELKINAIFGKCVFMFAEPVLGIHAFHRALLRIFGKIPKK
ncbi:MAG: CoA-binding protein [Bacteroidales bacterium]|nr:CoA-binding protein [Bacteroidales bacterium]